MEGLEKYRIEEAPDVVHYVPEFVSPAEESRLLEHVYAAPRPRWTQLAHRRLQNWGGLPHPRGMLPEPIPQWLRLTMERIGALGCFGEHRPNHVLVNEYTAGQGIMPHTDGPLFTPVITTVSLGSHALLDLYRPRRDAQESSQGGGLLEDSPQKAGLQEEEEEECEDGRPVLLGSLLLEPRSLLVVRQDAYHSVLHGIEPVREDTITPTVYNAAGRPTGQRLVRSTRVSLTIRHVPKVLKVRLRL
ncbi:LOW QUALITY PROTEIN: alpha-ketoglutarate-dependent dioxygenase alkB homolog 6-like [Pollicipes pollicipes]|uniref:LOW QUALITY PROTEIN: alpha-ketoglutarate-dependent dioxygenase alkB homolog 6-like n=1 Tax=Pollicipes pollicipes TaxID=41117 RepID=UPI001885428C|nr:LOW QUALITY PROTEIN: alpha-ketoglutarate-dependent dioxygenase alkB homolog 6-like [Pollicipes pollicipes]